MNTPTNTPTNTPSPPPFEYGKDKSRIPLDILQANIEHLQQNKYNLDEFESGSQMAIRAKMRNDEIDGIVEEIQGAISILLKAANNDPAEVIEMIVCKGEADAQ